MSGVDGTGAALVAAVGLLGTALLVLAHRLRAAGGRMAVDARCVESARRAAEAARAAREASAAERRVDDLAEVRATVRAMIERAEAVRALCDAGPAA